MRKTILFCNTWEPGRHATRPAPEDIDYPHYWIDQNYQGLGAPLMREAEALGVRITSLPYCKPEEADALCFWECPRGLNDEPFEHGLLNGKPLYLFATEHGGIVPENVSPGNFYLFEKVFTYYPNLIDGEKYIASYPMYFQVRKEVDRTPFEARKMSAMIGHIPFGGALSYSARRDTALWFAAHHPAQLDIYAKQTGYSSSLTSLPGYKGPCEDKRETLAQYKFSFCYENSTRYPGYISEKIFDCFFSGCIPVYLGAPDRKQYLPPDCYIDRADFDTHEALYAFLCGIDEAAFSRYQQAGQAFIAQRYTQSHSPEGFAALVMKEIVTPLLGLGQGGTV